MSYSHEGSSGQHCAVHGCTNNQRKRNVLGAIVCPQHSTPRNSCKCDMFALHRFPAAAELRQQWIAAVNRKDFTVTASSRVCSEHFVGGKRTPENAVPMMHLGYNRKVIVGRRRLVRHEHVPQAKKKRGLNDPGPSNAVDVPATSSVQLQPYPNAQPSGVAEPAPSGQLQDSEEPSGVAEPAPSGQLQDSEEPSGVAEPAPSGQLQDSEGPSGVAEPAPSGQLQDSEEPSGVAEPAPSGQLQDSEGPSGVAEAAPSGQLQDSEGPSGVAESAPSGQPQDSEEPSHVTWPSCSDQLENFEASRKEKWTQWEQVSHCDHNYSTTRLEPFKRHYVLASSLSENDCVFYTGVAKAVFDQLAKAASIEATKTFVSLSVEDQLLLTLMRLRLGLLYGHLARVFNVSVTGAHNIFKHMLSVLTTIMKKVVIWLPRAVIRNSTPPSFISNGFEKTTCIIDCSEIVLQRPKKLMPRAQTYSSYKARNTVKFLMAIAPNGYIMYVSAAYGGRASDKFITSDCGVEDYLGPGDEIMADRGFTLSPNLNVQGVKLNMPAFTRGKSQLTEKQVTQTRRIASVRIHVERAINRVKTYRIFQQALPIKSKKSITAMIFVCAGLCNLKSPLIASRKPEGPVIVNS